MIVIPALAVRLGAVWPRAIREGLKAESIAAGPAGHITAILGDEGVVLFIIMSDTIQAQIWAGLAINNVSILRFPLGSQVGLKLPGLVRVDVFEKFPNRDQPF